MDDIEQMVLDTYKHFHERGSETTEKIVAAHRPESSKFMTEIPTGPGLLYHLQRTDSVFVIRTLVSKNVRKDYETILKHPEEYPSLRLLDGGVTTIHEKLRFFLVENPYQAEIIHDQLNNRRFPMNEEVMCNLSDPGFSWWLTKKDGNFQVSFTISVSTYASTVKLGPLGDQQVALKSFQNFEKIMTAAGLELNIQNEMNRVQFTDGEEFLIEELQDLFEFGVVSDALTKVFKLIARHTDDHSGLETLWFYLQELAAMRRFWIQVQYQLSV